VGLDDLTLGMFRGQWSKITVCLLATFVAHHVGDHAVVEMSIVVATARNNVAAMLALVQCRKITTVLLNDLFNFHFTFSFWLMFKNPSGGPESNRLYPAFSLSPRFHCTGFAPALRDSLWSAACSPSTPPPLGWSSVPLRIWHRFPPCWSNVYCIT